MTMIMLCSLEHYFLRRPLVSFAVIYCEILLLQLAIGIAADEYIGNHVEHYASVNITYTDPATGELRSEKTDDCGIYGAESRLDTEWGLVVHVRSEDNKTNGCARLVNVPSERWIALIERGDCSFHTKISNAAIVSNASAVVIYDASESSLLTMKHNGNLCFITLMLLVKMFPKQFCCSKLWLLLILFQLPLTGIAHADKIFSF